MPANGFTPVVSPPSSQDPSPFSSIPAALSPSRSDPSTRQGDNWTPGQRYASLLCTCRLGYPLWKPSPRVTEAGKAYMINIGDVGVCSDMDPFHTLFNITKGEQVPEGTDPPRDTEGDITVDAEYHQKLQILVKPKGAILKQRKNASVYTFNLSDKEGAFLMLPRGGLFKKIQNTRKLKARIQSHWRQWYEFAEHAGYLDETQTLCLLTAVERCSTWAMAVWDSDPGYSRTNSDFLELTVEDGCEWSFPPAGCWTQSAPASMPIYEDPKETVFIRGIWINRSNGSTRTSPLPPPFPSENEDGNGDENSTDREPPDRGKRSTRPSQNPWNPFRNPNPSSSTQSPSSGYDRTTHLRGSPQPPDTIHRLNEGSIISLSADIFNAISHPCSLINKLALELFSQVQPSLLGSDYVAFSQDENWMCLLEDVDQGFPGGTELLRRICGKLKFVVEGGSIYTELMTNTESERVQRCRSVAENERVVIPVLFHFHDAKGPHTEPPPEFVQRVHVTHNEAHGAPERRGVLAVGSRSSVVVPGDPSQTALAENPLDWQANNDNLVRRVHEDGSGDTRTVRPKSSSTKIHKSMELIRYYMRNLGLSRRNHREKPLSPSIPPSTVPGILLSPITEESVRLRAVDVTPEPVIAQDQMTTSSNHAQRSQPRTAPLSPNQYMPLSVSKCFIMPAGKDDYLVRIIRVVHLGDLSYSRPGEIKFSAPDSYYTPAVGHCVLLQCGGRQFIARVLLKISKDDEPDPNIFWARDTHVEWSLPMFLDEELETLPERDPVMTFTDPNLTPGSVSASRSSTRDTPVPLPRTPPQSQRRVSFSPLSQMVSVSASDSLDTDTLWGGAQHMHEVPPGFIHESSSGFGIPFHRPPPDLWDEHLPHHPQSHPQYSQPPPPQPPPQSHHPQPQYYPSPLNHPLHGTEFYTSPSPNGSWHYTDPMTEYPVLSFSHGDTVRE
ncbi:hypothetical protein AAF712_004840 [Marasmius tenuissimus]|uniref:Uncharacterized protein n=1 Tax=Marasmius tenuissimus TaxID=585030 RepID=A0ABR3A3V1_9AGAR